VLLPQLESPQKLEIELPGIQNMHYANVSHFRTLLEHINVEDIVTIFTHMLFNECVILISPKVEWLVPISQALHSLISPFKLPHMIPYLQNDGEDIYYNSLQKLLLPFNYFAGIIRDDREMAMEILMEFDLQDRISPLIIDIEEKYKEKIT
jgi:hypothetical protein